MIAVEGPFDWRMITSPAHYLPAMKDCSGDKNDKSDKNKEIGKDDKSPRRATGSPDGPVIDHLVRLSPDATEGEVRNAIDRTMFS
jgi:hypothetical protein